MTPNHTIRERNPVHRGQGCSSCSSSDDIYRSINRPCHHCSYNESQPSRQAPNSLPSQNDRIYPSFGRDSSLNYNRRYSTEIGVGVPADDDYHYNSNNNNNHNSNYRNNERTTTTTTTTGLGRYCHETSTRQSSSYYDSRVVLDTPSDQQLHQHQQQQHYSSIISGSSANQELLSPVQRSRNALAEQEEQDLLLARMLQQEEERYAAVARAEDEERNQREETNTPPTSTTIAEQEQAYDEVRVIEYKAPLKVAEPDPHGENDFTLVNDNDLGNSSREDEICAICFDPLSMGIAVSLRACNHVFHIDCIDDALEHAKRCPTCRSPIRKQPPTSSPSGTLTITKTYVYDPHRKEALKLDYNIPSGVQYDYHDYPGEPFKGFLQSAYLPDNEEGNYLLTRLVEAFTRGLTFKIERDDSIGFSVVRWATIPHNELCNSTIVAQCHAQLDELGVP